MLNIDSFQEKNGCTGRRVLLVSTRDPRGRTTGRKLVLRTIVACLVSLGHRVTVAYFGDEEEGEAPSGVRFARLERPTTWELLTGCLGWLTRTDRPLNEVLYRSARAVRHLEAVIAEEDTELIVTDMVRTASYAERANIPWIADLDDTLSSRYRRMAENDGLSSGLLGYYRSRALRLALPVVKPFGTMLLGREARLILGREIGIARSAQVTTLVSPMEASKLSEQSGRPVTWTPMSIIGPETPPQPVEDPESGLLFLGGLDYQANLKSVVNFDAKIAPELRKRGLADMKLHVIGFSDETHRARLSSSVVLHGYVEDLPSELRRREAMIVPEVDPGGIKTKIVEALLHGVIVLAHSSAVQGIGLTSGKEVIVWSTAEELAEAVSGLRSGAIDRVSMVQAAFDWASVHFGFEQVRELWAGHVDTALKART